MRDNKSGRASAIGVQLDPVKVRKERQRRGWSRKDLAAKALVSSMTISNIERGFPCLPQTAEAIHKAFEEHAPTLDGLLDKSA